MGYTHCDKPHVTPVMIATVETMIASMLREGQVDTALKLLQIMHQLDPAKGAIISQAIELLNGGPLRHRN